MYTEEFCVLIIYSSDTKILENLILSISFLVLHGN